MWPAMGYGAELAQPTKAEDDAAEVVQNAAGRQILGTGRRTAIDATRGELWWIPLAARRKHQQLRMFHRLQSMPRDGLTGMVFHHRMTRFNIRSRARHRSFGMCPAFQATMIEYGVEAHFRHDATLGKREWSTSTLAAITAGEIREWKRRLAAADGDGARAWYRTLKTRWGPEPYLSMGGDGHTATLGRRYMAQMRCGTAPLQAIMHRHDPLSNPSPTCKHCPLGVPDDQAHAMCECLMHDHDRGILFAVVRNEWAEREAARAQWWCDEPVQWHSMTNVQRAHWLLRCTTERVVSAVRRFLVHSFRVRARAKAAVDGRAADDRT